MIEIKFRRKGKVIVVGGFPAYGIPEAIKPPQSLKGIDLTRYSVIYAMFGRGARQKAKNISLKAPNVTIVYKNHESDWWNDGWAEGVLLPERFSPSRVCFYKSAKQIEEEERLAQKRACEALKEEILAKFPDIYVFCACYGVWITPKQEVYCLDWG